MSQAATKSVLDNTSNEDLFGLIVAIWSCQLGGDGVLDYCVMELRNRLIDRKGNETLIDLLTDAQNTSTRSSALNQMVAIDRKHRASKAKTGYQRWI